MRNYLVWLGTLASIVACFLEVFGISGSFTWSSGLFLVAVALLALAVARDPLQRQLRFVVKRACKIIKRHAESTLDIAAGDCSWLPAEIGILEEGPQTA